MSKYAPFGAQTFTLGSSIGSTDTTITLTSFTEPVTNTPYTMVLLNTDIVYATIAPKTTSAEFISFTGIVQNSNGTATLTGVTRGLAKKYPFTSDAAYKLPHSGQSQFIISDAPQVFNKYITLEDAETITGLKTFPGGGDASAPVSGVSYAAPTNDLEYASKKYVDSVAIAGAPDATTTVKGIVEIATTAEINAGTSTGGTGASLSVRPDLLLASAYGLQLPTAGQKLALAGSSGTPGSGNEYITVADVSNAAASGKIVRASGTSLPALNGSALTNVAAATVVTATKVSFQTTQVTVASSNTETTLFTLSIAGGTLSTANAIKFTAICSSFRLNNNGNTATFKLYYGTTVIATAVITEGGAGATALIGGLLQGWIIADSSTAAQKGGLYAGFGNGTTGGNAATVNSSAAATGVGTATENSTGSLTMKLTVTFSVSDSNNNVTFEHAIIEKVY